MDAAFPYVVVGLVLLGVAIALAIVRSAVAGSSWSLSDALSEEVQIALLDDNNKPVMGDDKKPQEVRMLKASSSRLIALVGLIAILMMYVGFGSVVLKDFATSGNTPTGTNGVATFLVTGMSLFAPYVMNKFSSIFSPAAAKT